MLAALALGLLLASPAIGVGPADGKSITLKVADIHGVCGAHQRPGLHAVLVRARLAHASHCYVDVRRLLAARDSVRRHRVPASPAPSPRVKRSNGATQVTYNGHPLYTYVGDSAPGQASGNRHRLNGGWWYEMKVVGLTTGTVRRARASGLPDAGHQSPGDAESILVVATAGHEQSLLDDGASDVAAADEDHDQRVAQRKALQQIADLEEEVRGVDRMANEQRTVRAGPSPDRRRRSRRNVRERRTTARRSPGRSSGGRNPATTPQCGCAPVGRSSTPPNVPPKASSQSSGRWLTTRAGRRTR